MWCVLLQGKCSYSIRVNAKAPNQAYLTDSKQLLNDFMNTIITPAYVKGTYHLISMLCIDLIFHCARSILVQSVRKAVQWRKPKVERQLTLIGFWYPRHHYILKCSGTTFRHLDI